MDFGEASGGWVRAKGAAKRPITRRRMFGARMSCLADALPGVGRNFARAAAVDGWVCICVFGWVVVGGRRG